MMNKKMFFSIGLGLSPILSVALLSSCSTISYFQIVSKVEDEKIKEEVIASGSLEDWITSKINFKTKEWFLTPNNPNGYITLQAVGDIEEVIKNITAVSLSKSAESSTKLIIKLKIDPESDYRFYDNKVEHFLEVETK